MKLHNYSKALRALEKSIASEPIEDRDYAGIIKSFEFVYELAWKVLKEFLESNGHEVRGSKDAFRLAYQLKFIHNEDIWLRMIIDRNLTVHTYNINFATEIYNRIKLSFTPAFQELERVLTES